MSEADSHVESEKSEDRHGHDSATKEAFLEGKKHISDRTSPQLDNDPDEEWKTSAPPSPSKNNYQPQTLEDLEPSLLVIKTEEEDTKPPHLSLTLHTEHFNPTAQSASDEDVKPSPQELMAHGGHANPSAWASMWEEEEDVKPSPLDLLQITLHEQQAEKVVNFWTALEDEDSGSHSDEEPDSPASRVVVISDEDSEGEANSKSRKTRSPESVSDCELDLEQERPGRATKRSFQHLIRTEERPSKTKRLSVGDWAEKCSSNPVSSDTSQWHTHLDHDTEPPQWPFIPTRKPGPQQSTNNAETPLDFFRLFFTDTVILTLLENTNAYGYRNVPPEDKWTDFSFSDMFSFLSLVIFMGLLKLPQLLDYWKTTRLYNIQFPPSVMTRAKFLRMCRSLQMCCLEKDTVNQAVKGTKAYDRWGKIKPLFNQIVDACRTHFQPEQNVRIDERMVSPNEGQSRNKFTTANKLVTLIDTASGYTWNFTASEGLRTNSHDISEKGMGYNTVMMLMDVELLGTGYHLYFDKSYTTPRLLKDLWHRNVGACGSLSGNEMEFLKNKRNDFPANAPQGSMRWLRDGKLLFVKWKDAGEVALCSTIHRSYGGETVHRRLKERDAFVYEKVPVPSALNAFNRHMEGEDSTEGFIGFSSVLLKTKKWYRQFFYHFIDVAVVNAHVLYNQSRKVRSMSQREFRDALVLQLADAGSGVDSIRAPGQVSVVRAHRPVFLNKGEDVMRRRCGLCHRKTPIGCESCDMPLCLMPQRNCYNMWHTKHGL